MSRKRSAQPKGGSSGFAFPEFYHLPPFFTLQPVAETQTRQISMWGELIRNWCKAHRQSLLDLSEAANSPLFNNSKIKRRLSPEVIEVMIDALVKQGYAEWLADSAGKKSKSSSGRSQALIFYRKPNEWASLIYTWVAANGNTGSVLTVFEIQNAEGQEFQGLESVVLERALQLLESQGKAKMFKSAGGDLGVKFLG